MIHPAKFLFFPIFALSVLGCVPAKTNYAEEATKRFNEDLAKHKASQTRMWEIEASILQRTITENGEMPTIEKIKRDSIANFKDPDSVLFKDLKLISFGDGKLLCGSLNAKNGFGAYVGYKQFLASTITMHLPRKDERFAITTERMIRDICI
ncbi:hypothetical protein [Nitrincola sp.]|uniref:hypothetical protein n=1 Tax=Nitrincola sp. TaxID=1926584 RepID=UPI003A9469F7